MHSVFDTKWTLFMESQFIKFTQNSLINKFPLLWYRLVICKLLLLSPVKLSIDFLIYWFNASIRYLFSLHKAQGNRLFKHHTFVMLYKSKMKVICRNLFNIWQERTLCTIRSKKNWYVFFSLCLLRTRFAMKFNQANYQFLLLREYSFIHIFNIRFNDSAEKYPNWYEKQYLMFT